MFPIGLLSLVLFVELGEIAKSGPLPMDTTVALWFKNHRTPSEIHWAQVLSAISAPIVVLTVSLLVLLFLNYWTRSWYPRDLIPLAILGSSALLTTVSKSFFHRLRPGAGLTTLFDFEPSYPSSHTVFIAAGGCAFLFYMGRRQFLILVLIGLATFVIGCVRLTLGVHWLTDVFGSVFLSFGLLMIFYVIDDWLAEKESIGR